MAFDPRITRLDTAQLRKLHAELEANNADGRHNDKADAILEELRFRTSTPVQDAFPEFSDNWLLQLARPN